MTHHQRQPEPDEHAPIVAGSEARALARASDDLEAAWQDWCHDQTIEEQDASRLRAAFEAGYKAGAAARRTSD
jgi:hypothetical protein